MCPKGSWLVSLLLETKIHIFCWCDKAWLRWPSSWVLGSMTSISACFATSNVPSIHWTNNEQPVSKSLVTKIWTTFQALNSFVFHQQPCQRVWKTWDEAHKVSNSIKMRVASSTHGTAPFHNASKNVCLWRDERWLLHKPGTGLWGKFGPFYVILYQRDHQTALLIYRNE